MKILRNKQSLYSGRKKEKKEKDSNPNILIIFKEQITHKNMLNWILHFI